MAENDNAANTDRKESDIGKKWQKLHSLKNRFRAFFKSRIDTEGSNSKKSKLTYIALALVLLFSCYLAKKSIDANNNTANVVSAGFNKLVANDSIISNSVNKVGENLNIYQSRQDSTNVSMGQSLKSALQRIDQHSEAIRQMKISNAAVIKRLAYLERHVSYLDTIDKYTIKAVNDMSGGEAFRYNNARNDTLKKEISKKKLSINSKKKQ